MSTAVVTLVKGQERYAAMQLHPQHLEAMEAFVGGDLGLDHRSGGVVIATLNGPIHANHGDWVLTPDRVTFTAMSSEALAAGGYAEEAGLSVPMTRMRPVKALEKSTSGAVTSFAAAIRTRRGEHAEVSIRAGQSKSHRALCGMVVMRISEAEDFVAMCNAWNDAHFDKDSA